MRKLCVSLFSELAFAIGSLDVETRNCNQVTSAGFSVSEARHFVWCLEIRHAIVRFAATNAGQGDHHAQSGRCACGAGAYLFLCSKSRLELTLCALQTATRSFTSRVPQMTRFAANIAHNSAFSRCVWARPCGWCEDRAHQSRQVFCSASARRQGTDAVVCE
jgi:hypothetical protein